MGTICKPILLRRFVSDETAAPTAQFILSKLIPEDKAKIMSSTPTPANSGVNWNCLMWHPKPLKLLSDMYDRTIADKRRQLLATWVNNRSVQEAFGSVASLHQSQDQDDTHYEVSMNNCGRNWSRRAERRPLIITHYAPNVPLEIVRKREACGRR